MLDYLMTLGKLFLFFIIVTLVIGGIEYSRHQGYENHSSEE